MNTTTKEAETLSHVVKDEDMLRGLYKATHPLAVQKCLSRLDSHCTNFISRSPFLCVGTQISTGRSDVSPRGDQPGFVKVIDDKTIAIPDRPGNNNMWRKTPLLCQRYLYPGQVAATFEQHLKILHQKNMKILMLCLARLRPHIKRRLMRFMRPDAVTFKWMISFLPICAIQNTVLIKKRRESIPTI